MKAGVEEVFLPFELECRSELERKKTGIPLSEKSVGELNAMADRMGVEHIA